MLNRPGLAIDQLTSILPWRERTALQTEYRNKLANLHYLLENNPEIVAEIGNAKTMESLLAIALFYRRIIKPLEAGKDFAELIFQHDSSGTIYFGKDTINAEQASQLKKMVGWFDGFFVRTGLTSGLFSFVDVSTFVYKLRGHVQRVRQRQE